ncbi:hypothetical protein Lnau_2386 [Legionella nautarum]|uniref:Uncharacterized protein n=1 Tax=Legionella nautarum TaxID=45070 RepID=A0A0W0WK74_9GAMM|nr:hypothetical protein [Legionella nautarum]KTD32738.1 hypothetical protein Lnau_2386 [Legionella nautarum]
MPKEPYQSSSPIPIPRRQTNPQTSQSSYPAFFSPKQEEAAKASERAESLISGDARMSPSASLQPLSSIAG